MPEEQSVPLQETGGPDAKNLEPVGDKRIPGKRIRKLFRRAAATAIGVSLALSVPGCGGQINNESGAIKPFTIHSQEMKSTTTTTELKIPEFEQVDQLQKAIVLLAKENGSKPNLDIEQEKQILDNVANFYKEQSYGKINLQFNVVNWQDFTGSMEPTAPLDSGKAEFFTPAFDGELESLEHKGQLPGQLRLADYQTRIYIMNQGDRATIQGWGGHGEPYNRVWINQGKYSGREQGIAHEFGHALGLGHVRGMGHRDPYDFTNNSDVAENGGGDTVMGGGYEEGFAGLQRLELGWLDQSQVKTVTEDADVELTPIDVSGGRKLLRIPKPDTNDFYYVDFKTFKDQDPTLRFYIWDERSPDIKEISAPTNHGMYTGDGQEFYDQINGIRVKQFRHSSDEVGISVAFEKSDK